MAFVLKDRVKETTTTAGTGSVTLLGAVQGYQGFSSIGEGNTTYYCIAGVAEWEVGIGTYSGGVLSRDTVLASSANNTKVAFSAGTKDVFCTYAADKAISSDNFAFTSASSTSSPNATINVASLVSAVSSTNGDAAFSPKGTGALLGQVPTGTSAGGNKRGTGAVDWQLKRSSADMVASGSYSTIGGGENNKATNNDSTIAGGIFNQSTGIQSSVGGGNANIASATQTTVAGGAENTASATNAAIGGGRLNVASAQYATIAGGREITASGNYSFVGSGQLNSVTATHGAIGGGRSNAVSDVYGFVGGGYTNTASADYATVAGGYTNSATADYAVVSGGGSNQATGATSVAAGGLGNIASGLFASSGGGNSNTASGQGAVVPGGSNNISSGQYSGVLSGSTNTASGDNSVIAGGDNNLADGRFSGVIGGQYGTTRGIVGYLVTPASETPIEAKAGVQQAGCLVMGVQTTGATPTKLKSDTNSAGAANQLILQNNSAAILSIDLVGWDQTDYITLNVINGLIVRGANAAATVLKSPGYQNYEKSTGASTWAVSLSADTTNGGLSITVTGQTSKTIRWVARVFSTEVGF